MSLREDHLALMACPACRGRLGAAADALICGGCGASYPARQGVPDLLPGTDRAPAASWRRWRKKQERLEQWRRATWDASPGAVRRQEMADRLTREFFAFARLPAAGRVLEIGCGSGRMRRFLDGRDYWGLDPLLDRPPEEAAGEGGVFLKGIGEALPVADGCFETVLLCETLDHTLDPDRVIAEAFRALRGGGVLAVMQNIRIETPVVPLGRRMRVTLGRMKARLRGARRIEDGETKTHRFIQEDLARMVGGAFRLDALRRVETMLLLRAVKPS